MVKKKRGKNANTPYQLSALGHQAQKQVFKENNQMNDSLQECSSANSECESPNKEG
jgi:hypothetical protein